MDEPFDVTVTVRVLASSQAQAAVKLETQILTQMPIDANLKRVNGWATILGVQVSLPKGHR